MLQKLRNNMTNEIRTLSPDVLHPVMYSFRAQIQECERQAHLSDVIVGTRHI